MSNNIIILYSERDFKSTMSANKMQSHLFKENIEDSNVTTSTEDVIMFENGTNIEKMPIQSVNLRGIKADRIFIEKELIGMKGVLEFVTSLTREIYTYDPNGRVVYLGSTLNE